MRKVFAYGGTFDPIHNGHLKTAQCVYDQFKPDQFLFIPCKQPVLCKTSHASSKHRLAMLQLGIATLTPAHAFAICTFELESPTPSFTYITLEHLQQQCPSDTEFTFILGMDAFCQFDKWAHWQRIMALSKLLILNRAQCPLKLNHPDLKKEFIQRQVSNAAHFSTKGHGCLYVMNCGDYPESSTKIRNNLQKCLSIKLLCPTSVCNYIQQHSLYHDAQA